MNLKNLSDTQLVKNTKNLVAQELKCIVTILKYLIEIETRKLFSEYRYPTMLAFIIQEFGYTNGAGCRRLQSARMLSEMPEIEPKIRSGALPITILHRASIFYKKEKISDSGTKRQILTMLENKSQLECEKILLELTSKLLPSEGIRPVSKEHMQLKINVHESTHKKLDDVKCLMGFHLIDDDYLSAIADEAKENILRKRFKLTDQGSETHSSSRVPSNFDRRTAYEQALEKTCENCGGLFLLQLDHIHPYARGGNSDAKNLRLLCFHCNQRARIKSGL